jgi:hypothetical protein
VLDLEAALSAGADVPALLATRSAARSLLQASAAEVFAFTAMGFVLDGGTSLAVANFFTPARLLCVALPCCNHPDVITDSSAAPAATTTSATASLEALIYGNRVNYHQPNPIKITKLTATR